MSDYFPILRRMEYVKINIADIDLEVITVKVGSNPIQNYEGFGGTFAILADSCMRKKVLPGVFKEGIIANVELKKNNLLLSLSGEYVDDAIVDFMDIALKNSGAFPVPKGTAKFSVEVRK